MSRDIKGYRNQGAGRMKICEYIAKCESKPTPNCIPNYQDCMAYKFYKAKETGTIEEMLNTLDMEINFLNEQQ